MRVVDSIYSKASSLRQNGHLFESFFIQFLQMCDVEVSADDDAAPAQNLHFLYGNHMRQMLQQEEESLSFSSF